MSVIDLSDAVARRAQRDRHMAWCMKRWGGDLVNGREEGIAWAKNPANEQYLLNLWSWHWREYEGTHLDPAALKISLHMLLLELTQPDDDDLDDDEQDSLILSGLRRPLAEVVASLAGIVGEGCLRRMVNERKRRFEGFLQGWLAGALDYWDAARPDVGYWDEVQPPD